MGPESTIDHSAALSPTELQKVEGGVELWSDVVSPRRTLIMGWRLVGAQVVGKTLSVMDGAVNREGTCELEENKGQITTDRTRTYRGERKAGTGARARVASWSEGGLEGSDWLQGGDHRAPGLRPEWECHEPSHLLSHRHLHRPRGNMKLPKFLRLPIGHRRNRSKARSEIGPIEGQTDVDPVVLHPTESAPDLRAGTSILPTASPRDQKSNGM